MKTLGRVTYEHFGKTVYVTFYNDVSGKVHSRFYKNQSIADAQVTKFQKRIAREYIEREYMEKEN